MSRIRRSSALRALCSRLGVPAVALTIVLVACGGGAPLCETAGDETRVTVDASELLGDVRKVCIEDRCSSEGDGVVRLVARFTEERPERINFEVTVADGGGQSVRAGGTQLNCNAGGRDITLTPKPDGSDQVVVR